MPKYYFTVEATITMSVDIEAPTLAAAVKKAQAAPMQGLCHQCAEGERGEWNTSGEFDADPANSPLVAVGEGDGELDLEEVKKLWEAGQ